MSKKDKMADRSLRRRYVSYYPSSGPTVTGGGPCLLTKNFPSLKAETSVFNSLYLV